MVDKWLTSDAGAKRTNAERPEDNAHDFELQAQWCTYLQSVWLTKFTPPVGLKGRAFGLPAP